MILRAPEKYLNSIIENLEIQKDLSKVILKLILKSQKNLHFIIDENELDLPQILISLSLQCDDSSNYVFNVVPNYRFIRFQKPNQGCSDSVVFVQDIGIGSIFKLREERIHHNATVTTHCIEDYIPLSKSTIQTCGKIRKRISEFKENYNASERNHFLCNEKLLVIGNRNLFQKIPKDFPACFVSENENGNAEIEYNSPLLPKITVLKNIYLLDIYLQQEINGSQIKFTTCIFVGSSKFENSINIIRNYYNQKRFTKAVFIGEKDIKLDLGNNQIPLRWKWTIPEINFFKGKRNIQHKRIIIENKELELAVNNFFQSVKEIENKHTIGLNSIYRFIRRLYYDWNLKQETTSVRLHQIQQEFDDALKQLLIETLGNIFQDFDLDEYQKPLSEKFAEIIKALKHNNKCEKLKSYPKQIHQLILPSFLCKYNKAELNEIVKQSKFQVAAHTLQDISKLQQAVSIQSSNSNRSFHSLTTNDTKAEILSLSKSDDMNEELHKVISSIYGNGKIVKFIERLARSESEYTILLYSIEEKAFNYHINNYISDLNREYVSQDRYNICGVEFKDDYYQFSNYDELIEALASVKNDHKEHEYYRITFTDKSKFKLPLSKTVLKVAGSKKDLILVGDLNIGDSVRIYENPNKEILRTIFELKNPELKDKADEYSTLWRNCLNDANEKNTMAETLYQQLVKNHFSVSEFRFRKYLEGEVMFPKRFSDLIVIAKTINDPRLSFNFLKNQMKPKIEEYRGKEIEYGFKFSNSINHFIMTGEADEFISEWLNASEIENIVSQIPIKTVKEIELITQNSDD